MPYLFGVESNVSNVTIFYQMNIHRHNNYCVFCEGEISQKTQAGQDLLIVNIMYEMLNFEQNLTI